MSCLFYKRKECSCAPPTPASFFFLSVLCIQFAGAAERLDPSKGAAAFPSCGKDLYVGRHIIREGIQMKFSWLCGWYKNCCSNFSGKVVFPHCMCAPGYAGGGCDEQHFCTMVCQLHLSQNLSQLHVPWSFSGQTTSMK